jgi:hypothetical protein
MREPSWLDELHGCHQVGIRGASLSCGSQVEYNEAKRQRDASRPFREVQAMRAHCLAAKQDEWNRLLALVPGAEIQYMGGMPKGEIGIASVIARLMH